MRFLFSASVPVELRPMIRRIIEGWVEREDSPVVGVELFGRNIDFMRRPWPSCDRQTTVMPEREEDAQILRELLGHAG